MIKYLKQLLFSPVVPDSRVQYIKFLQKRVDELEESRDSYNKIIADQQKQIQELKFLLDYGRVVSLTTKPQTPPCTE